MGLPSLASVSPNLLGSPADSPFGPSSMFGFEVPKGSPGELDALAAGMRDAGTWFSDQLTRVQSSGSLAVQAGGGWFGQAASAFTGFAGDLAQTLSGNVSGCEQAAGALSRLAQALSQAQQTTQRELAECQRLFTEVGTQQQLASEAAGQASTYEQQLSSPMLNPAAVAEIQRQANLARGQQIAAEQAAGRAQIELKQAERRGQAAFRQYEAEAQALASRIQASAGELKPARQMGGTVSPALLTSGGAMLPSGSASMAAVIANPLGPLVEPANPGDLLSLITGSSSRDRLLSATDAVASGGAVYASDQASMLRRQLTDNARRIIQLDASIAQSSSPEETAVLSALRTGVTSESAALSQTARGLGARASFIESSLGPALLAVSFGSNLAGGKNVTEAGTSTVFSATFAWVGMRMVAVGCPVKTPVGEGVCAAAGALAGGFGGQAAAEQLKGAEDAVNRTLKSAWKDLSTPVGGGGLLSGVTPLMAVNP